MPARARADRSQRRLRVARDRSASGCDRGGSAPRRAPRPARASEGGCRRRGGARLPLRRRREGRATTPVLRAARDRRRARPPDRRPHPLRERRHGDDAPRPRRHRRHALLLRAGTARGGSRARLVLLLRRQRDLSEGRGAPGGRRGRAGRQDPRRDGQSLPRAAARPRPTERACPRRPHARGARRGAR